MSTRSASQQLKVGHCSFLALPSPPPCTMLRSPAVTFAARRNYQDWAPWRNYLCQVQWDDITARPILAFEIIVMQMHTLGLKNPSEQTSASLAAGIAAAEHGGRVQYLSAQDMRTIFLAVKATTACRGGYTRSRLQPLSQGGGRDGLEAADSTCRLASNSWLAGATSRMSTSMRCRQVQGLSCT